MTTPDPTLWLLILAVIVWLDGHRTTAYAIGSCWLILALGLWLWIAAVACSLLWLGIQLHTAK